MPLPFPLPTPEPAIFFSSCLGVTAVCSDQQPARNVISLAARRLDGDSHRPGCAAGPDRRKGDAFDLFSTAPQRQESQRT